MEESDTEEVMTEARMIQIGVIVLTATMFVVIGYLAPAMVAGITPQSQHIEVHQFTAQDAGMNATSHYTCMDRTTDGGQTADIYMELYTISQDGTRYEISSSHETVHMTEGRNAVMTEMELPEGLPEGEYRYSAIIEFHLADGRVNRQFDFVSDTFTVRENYTKTSLGEFSRTCGQPAD